MFKPRIDKSYRGFKIQIINIRQNCTFCRTRTKENRTTITRTDDKKDRLEKWIANISNNEELKQIVKENVKAVLSNNKILISTAFAAIIQRLRTDPQMVNLIYSIPINANNGEQHKDNNNNSIECIEANKDRLLDLAQKHFGNLVEVLTINAIDNTSPNPTLSSSSSTFPKLSTQSDTYRIEDPENFRNSRGDIAD
jgi:hypothetical protein